MIIADLALDRVIPDPKQPRKHFDEKALWELAASIRENGLMQPIKVRPIGDRYQIVAGERRWRAHKLLAERGHLTTIRAIVERLDDRDKAIQAIVENLQRADIRPIEEAAAFKTLIDGGMTMNDLAAKLGCLPYRIEERLGLLKLDEQLQKLVETGALAPTSGYEISKLPRSKQTRIFKLIAAGRLRGIVEIRAAVDAELAELNQADIFGNARRATKEEVATVDRMEAKVRSVADLVAAGWKDGECVIARKISPDRSAKMAEQIAHIRRHLQTMERELRQITAQAEMLLGEQ